jgi:hypothetical protein
LREVGGRRRWITIRLGCPRQTAPEEWFCPFYFARIVKPSRGGAYGIDPFQALLIALEGIRCTLDRSGRQYAWNDWEKGNTGFYRFVPHQLNGRFTTRYECLVDQAFERCARAGIELAQRRRKAKKQRRNSDARSIPRDRVRRMTGVRRNSKKVELEKSRLTRGGV